MKPKPYDLDGDEGLWEYTNMLAEKALSDPGKKEVIDALIADKNQNRRQLFGMAFCFGAIEAFHHLYPD